MQRLTTRAQFQAVMAGAVIAKTPHFAAHRIALGDAQGNSALFPKAGAWLGVVLPKRWARRAVTRNTLRRQIYEASRRWSGGLPDAAWVVRLRAEFSRQQFVSASSVALKQAARAELDQLFQRMARGDAATPRVPAARKAPSP